MDDGELLAWVQTLPISVPVSNLSRDFKNGVVMAEVLHLFFPRSIKLVDVKEHLGAKNWEMLNKVILTKMRAEILPPQVDVVVRALPGSDAIVAAVLDKVRSKIGDRPMTGEPVKPKGRMRGASTAAGAGGARARTRTADDVAKATPRRRSTHTAAHTAARGAPTAGPPAATAAAAAAAAAAATRGSSASVAAAAPGDGRRPVVPPMRKADGVLTARERQRRMSPPPAGGGAAAAGPLAQPTAVFRGGRNSMAPVTRGGSKSMTKAEFMKEFERRQREEERERQEASRAAAGGDAFGVRFDALMARLNSASSSPGGGGGGGGGVESAMTVSQHRRMTQIAETLENARLKNISDLQLTEQRLTRMRLAEKKLDAELVEHEAVAAKPFEPVEGWPGAGGGTFAEDEGQGYDEYRLHGEGGGGAGADAGGQAEREAEQLLAKYDGLLASGGPPPPGGGAEHSAQEDDEGGIGGFGGGSAAPEFGALSAAAVAGTASLYPEGHVAGYLAGAPDGRTRRSSTVESLRQVRCALWPARSSVSSPPCVCLRAAPAFRTRADPTHTRDTRAAPLAPTTNRRPRRCSRPSWSGPRRSWPPRTTCRRPTMAAICPQATTRAPNRTCGGVGRTSGCTWSRAAPRRRLPSGWRAPIPRPATRTGTTLRRSSPSGPTRTRTPWARRHHSRLLGGALVRSPGALGVSGEQRRCSATAPRTNSEFCDGRATRLYHRQSCPDDAVGDCETFRNPALFFVLDPINL
jgi:hypothetical protein